MIDRIFHQTRITISGLVEGADKGFLVVSVFFFIELLTAEEVINLGRLGLLHGFSKLEIAHIVISDEVDSLDSGTYSSVHREIHTDGITYNGIFLDLRLYFYIQKTFSLIISLDDIYGCLGDIVRELTSPSEVKTLHKFLLLSTSDT